MKKILTIWPYLFAILALFLAFGLSVSYAHAASIWSLVNGSYCNGSVADGCVSKLAVEETLTNSAIFAREAEGAKLWDGQTSSLFDFNNYGSPYQMFGGKGLGDWPEYDGQVVGLPEADACDGMNLSECLAVEGVIDHICVYYPGGVYDAFELRDCITVETQPEPEPTPTTTVGTTTEAFSHQVVGLGLMWAAVFVMMILVYNAFR